MEKVYPTGTIIGFVKTMNNLHIFSANNRSQFQTLTKREIEVLRLIAEGKKNSEISGELCIASVTIQNHRSSIRDKLNIKNQAEFVKYALAFDLLTF